MMVDTLLLGSALLVFSVNGLNFLTSFSSPIPGPVVRDFCLCFMTIPFILCFLFLTNFRGITVAIEVGVCLPEDLWSCF